MYNFMLEMEYNAQDNKFQCHNVECMSKYHWVLDMPDTSCPKFFTVFIPDVLYPYVVSSIFKIFAPKLIL